LQFARGKSAINCDWLDLAFTNLAFERDPVKLVKLTLALTVVAILLLLGLMWQYVPESKAPIVSVPSVPAANTQAEQSTRTSAAEKPRPVHAHEMPEGLDFDSPNDFRQQAHWFEAPVRDAAGLFTKQNTAMQIDASCAGRAELKHSSLEDAVQASLGVDVREAAPDNILVEEIAQFWQAEGKFFQISGRWDRDMPARYAMHHFSADDAAFSSNVKHLPLPNTPQLAAPTTAVDVQTLGEYFDELMLSLQKKGAQIGSRLVHAMPDAGDEAQDLKLNNGRIVSWMFGHGRCQRRTTGDAYCRCVADSTLPSTEEPFRVND
jgi:hypothetical protein